MAWTATSDNRLRISGKKRVLDLGLFPRSLHLDGGFFVLFLAAELLWSGNFAYIFARHAVDDTISAPG